MDAKDTEIEQLKQEVEELKELSEDTNKQVRKLRRNQIIGTVLTILWWLTIAGVSGAMYYYFLQPQVQRAISAYNGASDKAANFETFIADFMRQFQAQQ
jgi:hypothetical protein